VVPVVDRDRVDALVCQLIYNTIGAYVR